MLMNTHHLFMDCHDQANSNDGGYEPAKYNHFEHSIRPNLNRIGFEIVIHDPYEVVPSTENHFTLTRSDLLFLAVIPVISKIDDSLVDKDLDL